MKKLIPLFIFFIFCLGFPTVNAELSLHLDPEPLYNQVWAHETYVLNISGPNVDLTSPDYLEYDSTGRIVYNGTISWRGYGGYHHGGASTGYSYDLMTTYFQTSSDIESRNALTNLIIDRDSYQVGMKPFEEVQINIKIEAFLEIKEGGTTIGPSLGRVTKRVTLVDDEKVEYLHDKFSEVEADVDLILFSQGLDGLNRTKYIEYIKTMNETLITGDYVEALDLWKKWDNKERFRMFSAFITEVEVQTQELEVLQQIEVDHDSLQSEYDYLEDRYVAIFKENKMNLNELEATKQGLTTAITGVFLASIVFFFLGRRSSGVDVNA